MVNEVKKINKIDTLSDLFAIKKYCEEKYGKIITIYLIKNDENYDAYSTFDEILEKYNDEKYSEIKNVRFSIVSNLGHGIGVEIDKKNKLLSAKEHVRGTVVSKPADEVIDDITSIVDVKDSLYYQFDNGIMVAFDKNNNIYYRFDNAVNGWVRDNSIIRWFYDSEHDYVSVNHPKRGV